MSCKVENNIIYPSSYDIDHFFYKIPSLITQNLSQDEVEVAIEKIFSIEMNISASKTFVDYTLGYAFILPKK